jgi:hypothetical protein
MAIVVQYVFRAIPGKSATRLVESVKAGAALWKKHGASPRVWAVAVGEIGNMAFSTEFKSVTEYGKCYDALVADPKFQEWRAKNQESGDSEWVRSNMLREVEI